MLKFLLSKKQDRSQPKEGLLQKISSIFGKQSGLDEQSCAQIEKVLIESDFGRSVSKELVEKIKLVKSDSVSSDAVREVFLSYAHNVLAPAVKKLEINVNHKPHVIMVCGVNGNGKTTTIGKMAYKHQKAGLKVLIAACDTFRASAVEQLRIWAERASSHIFFGKDGADPASVAYAALKKAVDESYDLLLIDTAGRLHTQKNLMDELSKISRTLNKLNSGAPHDVLLVLDANTGQNALSQIDCFIAAAGVSGLVLAKFDGTAKGGVALNIASKYKDLKIQLIGVGEGIEDLVDFDVDKFCQKINF